MIGVWLDYLITCVDTVLRKHPESGFILTGDFNRLIRDQFLSTHYAFKQLVKDATRGNAILDKLWTNMSCLYDGPVVLDELGSSDHRMVCMSPSNSADLDTGKLERIQVRQ